MNLEKINRKAKLQELQDIYAKCDDTEKQLDTIQELILYYRHKKNNGIIAVAGIVGGLMSLSLLTVIEKIYRHQFRDIEIWLTGGLIGLAMLIFAIFREKKYSNFQKEHENEYEQKMQELAILNKQASKIKGELFLSGMKLDDIPKSKSAYSWRFS